MMAEYFHIYDGCVSSVELDTKEVLILDGEFAVFNSGIVFQCRETAKKVLDILSAKKFNPYVHPAEHTIINPEFRAGYKTTYITLPEFRTLLGMQPVEETLISTKDFEDIFLGMRRGILDIANEHEPAQVERIKSILDPIAKELSRSPFVNWDLVTKNFRQIFLMDYIDRKWLYITVVSQGKKIKLVTNKDFEEYKRVNTKHHSNNLRKFAQR